MSYWNDPVNNIDAITPSDSNNFGEPAHGIFVGGGGDVALETVNGSTAIFYNVIEGAILPVRTSKVLSTGTTATYLVRLW